MDIIATFLAKLRSGEKKQGRTWLKRNMPDGSFTYCCLGVLAEVCRIQERSHISLTGFGEKPGEGMATLTRKTAEQIGLRDGYGASWKGGGRTLSSMNDNGVPFTEIADIIEADPSVYFDMEQVKKFGDSLGD